MLKASIKKIFVSLVIVVFLTSLSYAYTSYFNRVIISALTTSAIGALVGGASASTVLAPVLVPGTLAIGAVGLGLMMYSKTVSSDTNKPYVSSSGDVSVPANVNWVEMVDGKPSVVQGNVSAKVKFDDIKNASSSPSKYPKLSSALQTVGKPLSPNMNIGDVTAYKGNPSGTGFIQLSYISSEQYIEVLCVGGQPPAASVIYNDAGLGPTIHNTYNPVKVGSLCYANYRYYRGSFVSAPAPVPATAAEFSKKLANSVNNITAPAGVYSDYYGDIDSFITDNPNVVHFEDGSPSTVGSNSSFSPPTPASLSQLSSYQAAQSADQAAQSAAQSATNAGNAYVSSGGNLSTGQGGDPALYQKYLEEKAKADAAQAVKDKLASEQSKESDASSYSGSFDNSAPYGDPSKTFDVGARFKTFVNDMKQTAVFSLPNQFLGNLPSSSTSAMTVSAGSYGNITFDFAQFNTLFAIIKTFVLVGFGWISLRIVLLKGGSS